jgi:hypothetical protein
MLAKTLKKKAYRELDESPIFARRPEVVESLAKTHSEEAEQRCIRFQEETEQDKGLLTSS